MSLHSWLQNLRSLLAPRRSRRNRVRRGSPRAASHRPSIEVLEDRCVPAQYAVTYLGDFSASDINEVGQVVGSRTTNWVTHAALWEGGRMIDLGKLRRKTSWGGGIKR